MLSSSIDEIAVSIVIWLLSAGSEQKAFYSCCASSIFITDTDSTDTEYKNMRKLYLLPENCASTCKYSYRPVCRS